MPGPYGPTTFDIPHPLDIETAILEVVDNSIDAYATTIQIAVSRDQIDDSSFEIRVYDNGTKISREDWNQEDIDKAFEIEIDPNDPEVEREPGANGKFHIGMKIAPLCRYNFISMFTLNGDNLLQKHGMYPEKDKIRENPNLIYGGAENPFDNTPEHIDQDEIETYFTTNNMNTCIIMSHPKSKILIGTESDYNCITNFRIHLKRYLGIVYQKYLEDDDFELEVLNIPGDEGGIVEPLDPFWSNFTPTRINEHKDTLEDDDEILEVANLARFGTLKTRRLPIEIRGHNLTVEGFIVPHRTSREAMQRYWPDNRYDEQQSKSFSQFKVSGSGSEKLASTNMGGFYFYRGKRCINFGGDLTNNQGFFTLIEPQNTNWCWRLRVKIEYGEKLDHMLQLHPNKKGYLSIHDEIWEAIKDSLSSRAGGDEYVKPFNQQRSFVLWDEKENQFNFTNASNLVARNQPKNFVYSKCEDCGFEIHESEDLCPTDPCPECGNAGEGCSRVECNHICTLCEVEECEGEEECDLNCRYCDEIINHENDEECDNYCATCESFVCAGHDEDEGEDEEEVDEDGEQNWAPSTMRHHVDQEEVSLMLNKNDRERNIEFLSETLEILEIRTDELV